MSVRASRLVRVERNARHLNPLDHGVDFKTACSNLSRWTGDGSGIKEMLVAARARQVSGELHPTTPEREAMRHAVSIMRIAVAGGTGTIGRRIAASLGRDGHEVRAFSRNSGEHPVDLRTGSGLEVALEGCEIVIDASNGRPSRKARAVLVDGSRHLLAAERHAGVRHHVCVSIVGIEAVPMGYYRVKVEQERVVESGGVPWTIVRSTQFHDLLGGLLAATGRWHVALSARARFQPVDVREAAEAVARAALGPPRLGRVTVAGPGVHDLRELGRIWRDATGDRAVEIPIPIPGRLGRALREGRLTCADPDVQGAQTFATWVSANTR